MSLLTYTLLAKSHNKRNFNCGVPELNTYLQKYAGQDSRERFTKCYAAVDENNNVAGFYTLSSSAIDISGLPDTITKKLPRYPSVPAALLGRLAVDSQFAGKGIGGSLLVDALLSVSRSMTGIWALHVDAKDEAAKNFYLKYGFVAFQRKPNSLYRPITNTLLKELASFELA
ncbi:GNAT family N-acetyltransferase [Pectobacterium versatile]|uniref:GNAT family N-acetyltransferase n=1 Tax=Pectobacterium versatile TaxID=2488639 RepID=UPI00208F19A5|nr:GNAT family N-acetyltransferase [Pectobacterium versatile]MCO4313550.1 GNAT family N-acetyltransferase [Pectobacterium versatile]